MKKINGIGDAGDDFAIRDVDGQLPQQILELIFPVKCPSDERFGYEALASLRPTKSFFSYLLCGLGVEHSSLNTRAWNPSVHALLLHDPFQSIDVSSIVGRRVG